MPKRELVDEEVLDDQDDQVPVVIHPARGTLVTEKPPYVWTSCCLQLDSRILNFAVQTVFLFTVLIFCIYMLFATQDDCSAQQLYSSILTLILGVYIPGPMANRK